VPGECAIYDPHPTLLVYAIHHTIMTVAISCIGQQPAGPPAEGTSAPEGQGHEGWPAMAEGSILLFLKYYDPQVRDAPE